MTDYSFSKKLTFSLLCTTHVGTVVTMAPEILEGDKKYDNKCDLWSIGVIIYQLLFKEYPYTGNTEYSLYKNIKKLGQKKLKHTIDDKLNDLIRRLLVPNPKERISWEEYFNHPFLKKILFYVK